MDRIQNRWQFPQIYKDEEGLIMPKKDMLGLGKMGNFNMPDLKFDSGSNSGFNMDLDFSSGSGGGIIGGIQSGAKKWKKNYKQMKQKYKGAKKSYGEARERVGELKEGLQRGTKDVKKKYRGLKRWVARHRR